MKLTQNQIDTIIEGLENPNTRLEVSNIRECITSIKKDKTDNGYFVSLYFNSIHDGTWKRDKKTVIRILETKAGENHTFELVTETRIKI